MSEVFSGFSPAHFDAYAEAKWKKNSHVRERTAAGEVAGRALEAARRSAFPDATDFQVGVTQDAAGILNNWTVDAKCVFLHRNTAELERIQPLLAYERQHAGFPSDTEAHHSEAILGLQLDAAGVEVGLRIHRHAALDRRNILALLGDSNGLSTLLDALRALPESIALSAGREVKLAPLIDEAWLRAALAGNADWLAIGAFFGRNEAVTGSPELVGAAARVLAALEPVYRLFTWRDDNDRVGGVERLARVPSPAEADGAEPAQAAPQETREEAQQRARGYRPGWLGSEPRREDSPREPRRRPAPDAASWNPPQLQRPAVEEARGPSSRARERAAELSRSAEGWTYNGPVRPRPEPERRDEPPRRDDGPRRDDRDRRGSFQGGDPQSSGRPGWEPGRGPPQGGDRQGPPGRRDSGGPGGHPRDGVGPGGRRDGGPAGGPPRDGRGPDGRRDSEQQGGRQWDGGNRGREPGGPGRGGDARGPGDRDARRGPSDGRGRGDGGGPRRDDRRPREDEAPRPPPPRKQISWRDAEGAPVVKDAVRLTGGLFAGKIGQVVEISGKGRLKVALGEGAAAIEVGPEAVVKVVAES